MAHDVHGIWNIVQSNGYRVQVNIEQTENNGVLADGNLTGFASEFTPHGTDISDQRLFSGTLSGNSFVIDIDWMNNTIGRYSGSFDPAGQLSGVTFDLNTPSAQATWIRV